MNSLRQPQPPSSDAYPSASHEYRLLIESFAQAVWETDAVGTVKKDSPSWRAYTGQTLEQWLGEGWTGAIHPDDRSYALEQWQQAVAAQTPVNAEFRLQSPDGGWRWTNVRATAIPGPDGSVRKWIGLNIDISDKKQAEEALGRSEERFRAFVTATSDAVYRMSADWRQMHQLSGKSFLSDTGNTGSPADGSPVANVSWLEQYIPTPDQAGVQAAIDEAIKDRKPFELAHRVIQADGGLGWTFSRAIPILNQQGEITEWFGTARDITGRKRAEEALAKSEEKYRWLFETMDAGFAVGEAIRDERGKMVNYRLTQINPAFEKLTGLDLNEAVGKTILEVLPGLDSWWLDTYQQVVDSGETVHVEEFLPQLNRWYDVTAFYYGKEQFAAYYNDITDRKRQEANLVFLAQISADFAPLTSAEDIMQHVAERLANHLRLSRCLFAVVEEEADRIEVIYDWNRDGTMPPLLGVHRISDNLTDIGRKHYSAGELFVMNATQENPMMNAPADVLKAIGFGSLVDVPHRQNGRWTFLLTIGRSQTSEWRDDELELIRELAARIYIRIERARAEEDLRQSEAKFRTLFETMEEGFAICEGIRDEAGKLVDYRHMLLNPAYERLTGLKREDALGKRALEIAPDMEHWWFETFQQVLDTGETIHLEQYFAHFVRWYEVTAFRYTDKTFAYLYNDITERKRHEANLAFLADVSRDLVDLKNIDETMNALGAKIGRHFTATRCAFFEFSEAMDSAVCNYDWHQVNEPSLVGNYRTSDFYTDEFLQIMRAGEAFAVRDRDADSRVDAKSLAALNIASLIVIPIVTDKQLLFVLCINDTVPRDWHDDEIELMRELTTRIWTRLERARAEEALRQTEERFRTLVQNLPDYAIFRIDPASIITEWTEGAQRVKGYTADEAIGQPLSLFYTPEGLAAGELTTELAQATQSGRAERESIRIRKGGQRFWVNEIMTAIRDEAGRLVGFTKISRDITGRKVAEEALRDSRQRFQIVLDSTADHAIITTDPQSCITGWNSGAEQMFGYAAEEAIGQSVAIIFTPEDRATGEMEAELATAHREGRAPDERYHLRKDGSRLYVSGVWSPLYEADGQLLGYVKVARDMTERRRMEQALREADGRKDEFLAMLAHELRNPMAPIRNGLQVLTMAAEPHSETGPLLKLMNRQVDHLVRLVDDLLDVSRISRGKIELHRQRVDLGAIVSEAVEAARPLYQTRGQTLDLALPATPRWIEGDATRLAQVVANLLTNGTRYTREGGRVGVTLESVNGEALLQVADNGIGLAPEQLETIFELFVQVDNSLARSQGGLGLGLTLIRRLVEMHGGRVEVRSEGLGQGSEFRVYLPLLNEDKLQPTMNKTTPQPTGGRVLLVIDDNADAALTLAMLLKLEGYVVHTRHSGRAGLEAAEQLQPAVILLDLGMPDLDGYQTCRLLRQQPWGKDMPVVALTGYGLAEDQRQTKEAGFNAHLVKPVDLAALTQVLFELTAG